MFKLIGQIGYWSLAIAAIMIEDKTKRLLGEVALRIAITPAPKYLSTPPSLG